MKLYLAILSLLVIQAPAYAQLCAINRTGQNLCDGAQNAYLSNTSTSVTIHGAGQVPTAGSYGVTISYYRQATNSCQPVLTCTGSVTSSGNDVTIVLGGCTLPANFYTEGIVYINLTSGPGGAQYFFHIYGGFCMLPLPIELSAFNYHNDSDA